MNKVVIKPYDVVTHSDLPELPVTHIPSRGDPLEIGDELYFVCELEDQQKTDTPSVGVIPLVVRNPAEVTNIKEYIRCLSIAHRKVQFRNDKGNCDFDQCDEMIISE